MSYLWQEFNIKTFPAETLVFRDGEYIEDLTEHESVNFDNNKNLISVDKKTELPVHIIYVGEISGDINLNINVNVENTKVIIDIKTVNKKSTFLNVFVKNNGKNSVINGQIVDKNKDKIKINVSGQHLAENTDIFIKTRVVAYKSTLTELFGSAKIEKDAPNSNSDISFSVMADESAKVILKPTQYINSVPKSASHSASLYKPTKDQVNYLSTSGLGTIEINQIMEEAFLN